MCVALGGLSTRGWNMLKSALFNTRSRRQKWRASPFFKKCIEFIRLHIVPNIRNHYPIILLQNKVHSSIISKIISLYSMQTFIIITNVLYLNPYIYQSCNPKSTNNIHQPNSTYFDSKGAFQWHVNKMPLLLIKIHQHIQKTFQIVTYLLNKPYFFIEIFILPEKVLSYY